MGLFDGAAGPSDAFLQAFGGAQSGADIGSGTSGMSSLVRGGIATGLGAINPLLGLGASILTSIFGPKPEQHMSSKTTTGYPKMIDMFQRMGYGGAERDQLNAIMAQLFAHTLSQMLGQTGAGGAGEQLLSLFPMPKGHTDDLYKRTAVPDKKPVNVPAATPPLVPAATPLDRLRYRG